jgi:sugar phosphate isomerase/epimerase
MAEDGRLPMKISSKIGQLTYCTNIHRGETWAQVWQVLQTDVLAVKKAFCPDRPFGVGLRLSWIAIEELRQPEVLSALKDFLKANDLYVFTLNAFPYGPFHGVRVKEAVYLPDWRAEERLRYADAAADLLAQLLPAELALGSVSTAPGAYKSLVTSDEIVDQMVDRMLRHASHLVDIERRTGRMIALAIEPEPSCFLETTDEVVDFFDNRLFSSGAAKRLAELTGLTGSKAEEALRRHLGLCLDLCHAAVEFEEPAEVFEKLRKSGISVPKMQISSGLRLPNVDKGSRKLLEPFDDGVYLHQVIERNPSGLRRYTDLEQAFAALDRMEPSGPGVEWRVHYHVPVFLDDLGPFASTQSFIREALALHVRDPLSQHLEVETYTWEVLPQRYRTSSLVPAIARELQWVRQQLTA